MPWSECKIKPGNGRSTYKALSKASFTRSAVGDLPTPALPKGRAGRKQKHIPQLFCYTDPKHRPNSIIIPEAKRSGANETPSPSHKLSHSAWPKAGYGDSVSDSHTLFTPRQRQGWFFPDVLKFWQIIFSLWVFSLARPAEGRDCFYSF